MYQGSVFSEGFVSEVLEPIKPIKMCQYWCDKKFHLDNVFELFEKDEIKVGLMMLAGEECHYYDISGEQHINYKLIYKLTVHRDNKQKNGGSSAPRFQRIRLNQITEYAKKMVEKTTLYFNDYEKFFVFSCTDIQHKFLEHLTPNLKNKIINNKIYTVANLDINPTQEIVKENILSNIDITDDVRKLMDQDLVIYGMPEIEQCIQDKNIEKIYIDRSETILYDAIRGLLIANDFGKCQIIRVKSALLQELGNIIAIKYFNDISIEEN